MFARGLAYVAISRVKSLQNLFLLNRLNAKLFQFDLNDLKRVDLETTRLEKKDVKTRLMYATVIQNI